MQATRPEPQLDEDRCYAAAVARDHRFDGRFFTAVRTTRLYCRPICPGRARRENVEFFRHAAVAESAGYRPCLRCRPEDAPKVPGHSDPASTARLDFSRKLVVETGLPLEDIARISSFRSEGEFEAAFEARFRRPPGALRRSRAVVPDGDIVFSLPYRPPLDWKALLGYCRDHSIHGLDGVGGDCFERVFELGGEVGWFCVEPDTRAPRLRIRVVADEPGVLFEVHRRVRRMFDLDADPIEIAERFAPHPVLGPLWGVRPGLRIGRGWDPFEVSVCTVLGQLVSVAQGRALVRQLVEGHGRIAAHPITGEPVRLFPSPEVLASAGLEDVRTSRARKEAIRALSGLVASGSVDLAGGDVGEIKRRLLSLPGVGPWTSEYIGLRGLGDADAFPGTDLVLKRALASNAGMELDTVRPFRGYAAACLWASHPSISAPKRGDP